jgi:SAM-dependent methyltransferase
MKCPFCAKQELSFFYSGDNSDQALLSLPGKSISVTYGSMDRLKQHPESEIRECEDCHTLWTLSYDYSDHPPVVITGNVVGHDLKSTYNRIAKDFLEDHKSDTWGGKSVDFFLSVLPPQGKVLDLGCGPGLHSKIILDKGFSVVGVDISEEMIKLAKEIAPEGRFEVQDMRRMRGIDHDFDGIHARASLLHLKKSEAGACIKHLTGHLKPGGVLYVAVKGVWNNGIEEHVKRDDDYGYSYERFFSYYTNDDLKSYFASAGLEILFLEEEFVGKTIWREIIGRKKT